MREAIISRSLSASLGLSEKVCKQVDDFAVICCSNYIPNLLRVKVTGSDLDFLVLTLLSRTIR